MKRRCKLGIPRNFYALWGTLTPAFLVHLRHPEYWAVNHDWQENRTYEELDIIFARGSGTMEGNYIVSRAILNETPVHLKWQESEWRLDNLYVR